MDPMLARDACALACHLGVHTDARLRKLTQKINTHSCTFLTGEWADFVPVLPENRHFFGKVLTVLIEQTHHAVRHQLARFKRKTKASSRSMGMVQGSLTKIMQKTSRILSTRFQHSLVKFLLMFCP